MRLFKHGSSLAIVIPDSLIQRRKLKEGEELEVIEIDDEIIALVTKTSIKSKIDSKLNEKYSTPKANEIQTPTHSVERNRKELPAFLIIDNEIEAREFSRQYENQIKEKILTGVRSFDKKFYIIRNDYFDELSKKIISLIKKNEMKLEDICLELKTPKEPILCTLLVMKENGDVIERRKDYFKLL